MKSQIAVYLTENAQRRLAAQGKNANRYQVLDADLNPDSPLTKELRIDADGVLRGYIHAQMIGDGDALAGERIHVSSNTRELTEWTQVGSSGTLYIMPLEAEPTIANLERLLTRRTEANQKLLETIASQNPADWDIQTEYIGGYKGAYVKVLLDDRRYYPRVKELPAELGELVTAEYQRREAIRETEEAAREAARKAAWELEQQQQINERKKKEDERSAWIASFGSELLKANDAHGLHCNRSYVDERLAHDYPNFELDSDGKNDTLKCASIVQLQSFDELVQKYPELSLELTWIKFPHVHSDGCYDDGGCDLEEDAPAGAYAVGTSATLDKSIRIQLKD